MWPFVTPVFEARPPLLCAASRGPESGAGMHGRRAHTPASQARGRLGRRGALRGPETRSASLGVKSRIKNSPTTRTPCVQGRASQTCAC